MKKISRAFIMVLLIGAVTSTVPSAFANPGLGIALAPTNISPGGTSTGQVNDIPFSGSAEKQIHAHATLAVIGGTGVPTDPIVCFNQATGGGKTVYRLVANINPALLPAGTELNGGGSADIHITWPALIAGDTSKVSGYLFDGTGTPFTPIGSDSAASLAEQPKIETKGTDGAYPPIGGFILWTGTVVWAKDGDLSQILTTNNHDSVVNFEQCAFIDVHKDKTFDPLLDGGSIAFATFSVTSPTKVNGTILPVDKTPLFVSAISTNGFWLLSILGGIAVAAIALFKVKRKRE